METNNPQTSLELDPHSTGISPVSSTPATAEAVIPPTPVLDIEEEQDAQDDKVQRSRPKALPRNDLDRPQHMRRLLALHRVLAAATLPLVPQTFDSMLQVHETFSEVKKSHRGLAADWLLARRDLDRAVAEVNPLLAYCAQQVRRPQGSTWTVPDPVDPTEVELRLKRLLNGFVPSDIRADPAHLLETVKHLDQVLHRDPQEVGRWDPAYCEAVHQGARTLARTLAEAGALKQAYGEAMHQLRAARAEWDLCWSVLEKLVLGWFTLKGRRHAVEKAFEPIRKRPVREGPAQTETP